MVVFFIILAMPSHTLLKRVRMCTFFFYSLLTLITSVSATFHTRFHRRTKQSACFLQFFPTSAVAGGLTRLRSPSIKTGLRATCFCVYLCHGGWWWPSTRFVGLNLYFGERTQIYSTKQSRTFVCLKQHFLCV